MSRTGLTSSTCGTTPVETCVERENGYAYGFNGKPMDNEVAGTGTVYDYGFRVYNASLGKFLSVDPLTKSYPWYTPYQFAGNKPIIAVDLDGLEEKEVNPFTPPTDPNLRTLEILVQRFDKDIEEIWAKSFSIDGNQVEEWGFVVYRELITFKSHNNSETYEDFQRTNYVTSHKPNRVELPSNLYLDTRQIIMDVHTHPYPRRYLNPGAPFSGGDILGLKDKITTGRISLVEAGTKRYALIISNEKKATMFLSRFSDKSAINREINKITRKIEKETGTTDGAYERALAEFLYDSGIDFYASIDSEKKKFEKVEPNQVN